MVVRVIDIETYRIVRELGGFRGRILDIAFSPDSRWLIVSSLDCAIRTFDLPSGSLVDVFRTPSAAASISFSPQGDFLASAHVGSVGVFLWTNRAQFTDVSLRSISDDAPEEEVGLPSVAEDDEALEALSDLDISGKREENVFATPAQLEGDLVTLTLLPRARWQTLLNIEVIQQRNKPKEPPKAPEKAPFFLPTLPGVETRFAVEKPKEEEKKKNTRRLDKLAMDQESIFQQQLEQDSGDCTYHQLSVKSLAHRSFQMKCSSITPKGCRQRHSTWRSRCCLLLSRYFGHSCEL
jgi:U3 small nucleolar RNA-associated protein 21